MLDKYIDEQISVTKLLNNSINTGRYSHAYLFVVNNYEHATDFIYSFIKELCCPNNKKCENCNICDLIDTNTFSDFKVVDSDSLIMKKELILELQDYFDTKKIYAKKRVYLIKNCEKMNVAASNTLLKFLEEPEDDIIAILTTDNINQVIDTIKSRCQIIYFNTSIDNNDSLYNIICGDCSISSEQFEDDVKYVLEFCKFYQKNRLSTIAFSKHKWHERFSDRVKFVYGLNIMLYVYMDVVNYKLGKDILYFTNFKDTIVSIASSYNLMYYVSKIKIILKYIDLVKYNVNLSLCFDKILIDWEGAFYEENSRY